MASLSLKNIGKSYGKTKVLQGVDLEIADGEFLVLVGPSGCGKSTLLRCIAGLEAISAGELFINERLVNYVEPRDRGVAMVFQSYALYPHMTVRENMGFALKIRKEKKEQIKARVEEVGQMLGLHDLLDRYPKELSGGQRQRVAMGRAIVREPQVFLFDEPLSNLDAKLRTQMRVELKKLHERLATTMVYVTHDQVEAMTLADRIAVLDKGTLQQVGSPQELFERPINRFVAQFIGSPAMNILSADKAREAGIELPPNTHEVGLRPQHLSVHTSDADPSSVVIKGTLDLVESMGWEAYVHVELGEQMIMAQLRAESLQDLQPGDAIALALSPDRLHFFDKNESRLEPAQILPKKPALADELA